MHIDFGELSPAAVYAMMTQTIVPRPVAWVLSRNADNSLNLAPFSYFSAVCSAPPIIMLSIGKHVDGREKDTRRNIRERDEFVVHIAHRGQAEFLTATSASLAPEDSELERAEKTFGAAATELAAMPGSSIPRLKACRVAYACRHEQTHEVGPQGMVLARVSDVWLDDAIVGKDAKDRLKVDAKALDALGRLGGGEYITAGEVITVDRPA
jgi:flavin reductase (DIM6/NTAB) family NADH-FMN oxidoreductase RutF